MAPAAARLGRLVRSPILGPALVFFLICLAISQGTTLSSDLARELEMAQGFAKGALSTSWHASPYPFLPGLYLLPAGLGGDLFGFKVASFLVILEFALLGAAMVALGMRWAADVGDTAPTRSRALVIFVATFGTLLWVFVAKVPMDIALAATLCLAVVVLSQRGHDLWTGVALGLLVLSRSQMVAVAAVGLIIAVLPHLRRRELGAALRLSAPVAAGLLILLATNRARFGGILKFGHGYDHLVHYGLSWKGVTELFFSTDSGLVFFAPLVLVGAGSLWWRWRSDGPRSAPLAVGLSLAILCSVLVIHPLPQDLLHAWYGWGQGCRFLVPMIPLTTYLLPLPLGKVTKLLVPLATLVGVVWSGSLLLVPYDAQERLNPGVNHPSALGQWRILPTVWSNTWHLITTGSSPWHHSGYFVSLWQVEVVRLGGIVTLALTIPATIALLVVAVLLARRIDWERNLSS